MQPSIAHMTKPTIQPGSVSRGTQLPYDLHHAFAQTLAKLHPEAHEQLMHPANGHPVLPSDAVGDRMHYWWKFEGARHLVACLEEALNECAPQGMFFGSSYGDESDYGFWEHE